MVADPDRTPLAPVFWLALGLATLTAAGAIFTARDLAYDGSHYLLGVAGHGGFEMFERARRASQFLQQGFAVAGARLGIRDLWTLGVLFSAGASGWPVILTTVCWFVLPRGQKGWIAGPLLNLILAIPVTSFIGIGEGIVASCLLWLAFLMVEFRSQSAAGAMACIAACAVCGISHEAAALCVLIIALAGALRASESRGLARIALLVASVVALLGAANLARWILFPRSTIERSDFLVSILGGFFGTPSGPNIPALITFVGVIGCAAAFLTGRAGGSAGVTRARAVALVTVIIIAALFAVLAANPAALIAPSRYFAARGLPVALTTLLAGSFLLLLRRGLKPDYFATPPVLAILFAVTLAQAAAQALMTAQWASYVSALRGAVSTQSGIVTHDGAMKLLDPGDRRFRRELLENWSVEPLSILLAPGGRVRAVVEPSPKARWVPYDPEKPAQLPHAPGLDWSAFVPRRAL